MHSDRMGNPSLSSQAVLADRVFDNLSLRPVPSPVRPAPAPLRSPIPQGQVPAGRNQAIFQVFFWFRIWSRVGLGCTVFGVERGVQGGGLGSHRGSARAVFFLVTLVLHTPKCKHGIGVFLRASADFLFSLSDFNFHIFF